MINAQDLLLTHLESGRRMNPGGEAVWTAEASLSRAELEARSSRLAHHLRSMGVGPDVMVGICTERSWEMVVVLLATIKAGGAMCSIAEELNWMTHSNREAVGATSVGKLDVLPDAERKQSISGWNKAVSYPLAGREDLKGD